MRRRSDKGKRLVQQEVALGKQLFISRGKRSEISGVYLGDDYDHVFASHILTKGASPKFRCYHKNIVLMTYIEHHQWEFERHTLRGLPEWQWVFQLFELLQQEYNQTKHYNVFKRDGS